MANTQLPSERSFGLLFVLVTAALAAYGFYKGWAAVAVAGFLASSVALALVTWVSPSLLAPLNKAWFHLGQTLGKIVSPIVLGIIFYGLLTPVALATRAFGRDELKLKRRRTESCWVERTPPGPVPDSFINQF